MPQYHVGESENGAYFHFIICFPVFFDEVVDLGEIYV